MRTDAGPGHSWGTPTLKSLIKEEEMGKDAEKEYPARKGGGRGGSEYVSQKPNMESNSRCSEELCQMLLRDKDKVTEMSLGLGI